MGLSFSVFRWHVTVLLSPQHAVLEFDAFETGEAAESPGHVFRDDVKGRDKEDAA